MERVQVRVIRGSIRRKGAGEVVSLSRRDARLLTKLGRVEAIEPSEKDDEPKRRKTPKRGTPVKRAKAKTAPKTKRAKKAKVE
jgi:hypothetical protein